jgi:hypothetical protein
LRTDEHRTMTKAEIPTEDRTVQYRCGAFAIDGFGPYAGYHRPGVDWNGWATPAFDRETADRIAADFSAQGEGYTARYDAARDSFLFGEPDNDWDDDIFVGFNAPLGDDQLVLLYGIGTFTWTWEVVDAEGE